MLFNPETLRQICMDASTSILNFPIQTPIYGDDPLDGQADPGPVANVLVSLAQDAGTPLWQLQWVFLVMVYLSDSLVATLGSSTPPEIFGPWYSGIRGTQMTAFRARFELHVGGGYSEKRKRGSRKTVTLVAKSCLEVVVAEVMHVHVICGLEGARVRNS